MSFRDLIQDVFRTLWGHRLRTLLTMFGISWGVVSIVLMVAAGEGLRVGQAKQAETLGRDLMIVFHGRTSLQAGGTRAGRLVRWLVLSLLVLKLGPSAVSLMGDVIKDHLALFLSALVLIFAAIGIWAIKKRRKNGEKEA